MSPTQGAFEELFGDSPIARRESRLGGEPLDIRLLARGDARFEFVAHRDPEDGIACLKHHYVNMVVVDLRGLGDVGGRENQIDWARDLLKRLDHVEDIEQRYGFHRILVLVPAEPSARVDDFLVELGGAGVRHVLRDVDRGFASTLLDRASAILADKKQGRTALCASGGGITGIFFEMGAIKCLDDALVGGRVNDFDMLFGISAGAVVTSLLAVGYTIGEMMAALAGHPGGAHPASEPLAGPREPYQLPRHALAAGHGAAIRG